MSPVRRRPVGGPFQRLLHLGKSRYCPACGAHTRAFVTYGSPPRPDARCPICHSLERERAQVLTIRRLIAPRFAGGAPVRVLHVAPEAGVERALRAIPGVVYLSGDMAPGCAMQVVDLTALQFPDGAFDLIFVSHVLEHIEDDRRAMAEMLRVLALEGVAFVEVPVLRQTTIEDPSVRDRAGRKSAFGQSDHVRVCGSDYGERLREAGFAVQALSVREQFSAAEIARSRLLLELPEAARRAMPSWYERHFDVAWLCSRGPGGAVSPGVA